MSTANGPWPTTAQIKCVVPISGGKDSQVCLELALAAFPRNEVVGLFCDTGWEHPKTYAHVEWMRSYYGVEIDVARFGHVLDLCLKHGRFPGGGARFCTSELKIKPTKIYCRWLARAQGAGFEVWYGMRSGESNDRAKRYAGKVDAELYAPHEIMPSNYPKYLAAMGVQFRLPIIDWSEDDVLEHLDGRENPLYETRGRVGCNPCFAGGDASKEQAFYEDDFGRSQLIASDKVAVAIGKPVFNSKGGQARNGSPGCMVCSI